jgi:hypothetical protein
LFFFFLRAFVPLFPTEHAHYCIPEFHFTHARGTGITRVYVPPVHTSVYVYRAPIDDEDEETAAAAAA